MFIGEYIGLRRGLFLLKMTETKEFYWVIDKGLDGYERASDYFEDESEAIRILKVYTGI